MKITVYMDWIVPYVRTTQRAKWVDPAYKRYQAWKDILRVRADMAKLPRVLDADKRYRVSVVVNWKKRARADLDNIVKGALDALFEQDRRVLELRAAAYENGGADTVMISVNEVA